MVCGSERLRLSSFPPTRPAAPSLNAFFSFQFMRCAADDLAPLAFPGHSSPGRHSAESGTGNKIESVVKGFQLCASLIFGLIAEGARAYKNRHAGFASSIASKKFITSVVSSAVHSLRRCVPSRKAVARLKSGKFASRTSSQPINLRQTLRS